MGMGQISSGLLPHQMAAMQQYHAGLSQEMVNSIIEKQPKLPNKKLLLLRK